jgi:hypothetical protein
MGQAATPYGENLVGYLMLFTAGEESVLPHGALLKKSHFAIHPRSPGGAFWLSRNRGDGLLVALGEV